jgi:orotidine 5'-phosphate decarboxylase subfamily 2
MYDRTQNAGVRLLAAQKAGRSNLCIGLDAHFNAKLGLDAAFYGQFAEPELEHGFLEVIRLAHQSGLMNCNVATTAQQLPKTLSGLTEYFLQIIQQAFKCGIYVFKPQAAFYERLGFPGMMILHRLLREIHELGQHADVPYFVILDAKRGDIETTQGPYYEAYLATAAEECIPGLPGQYDFDAMTVTTWMGEEVVLPGLSWFKKGRGAIVVTRSSNPSGTCLQDARIAANPDIKLIDKQEPYRLTAETIMAVWDIVGRPATVADMMMFGTGKISAANGLDDPATGISPLFHVIGSTVVEDGSFRKLRPGAIALVPGFGAQKGKYGNMMPILAQDGPMAGQGAICSSSRGHNFAFLAENGGDGNPQNIEGNLRAAIEAFRQNEKAAYDEAGIVYPYAA